MLKKTIFVKLVFILIFLLAFLSAETLSLTLDRYLEKVKEGNVQNQLNSLLPSIQRAIYKEDKYIRGYGGVFTGNYSQNITDGPPAILPRGQRLEFDFGWRYKLISSGTTFSATLKNSLQQNPASQSLSSLAGDDFWINTLSLRIDQPLLRNGFIQNENQRYLDVNKFNAQLAESKYNQDFANLMSQAILLYWQYQINLENFAFQREQLSFSREILRFNERKEALGAINKTDVLENESQIINAQINLDNSKKDLDVLKKNLLIFMGIPLQDNNDLKIKFEDSLKITKVNITEEKAYNEAINNRDELIDLKIQSDIAENALVLANLSFLPELNAFVKYDINGLGEGYGDAFSDFSFGLNRSDVSFGVSLKLFTDLGAYRVPSERPNLLIEQAKKGYTLFIENLRREIFQRVSEYKNAYDSYIKNRRNLAIQQRKFRLNTERYKRGEINFVVYINGKNTLNAAQIGFLRSKLGYLQAYLSLELSKGTLLKNIDLDKMPISQKLPFQ